MGIPSYFSYIVKNHANIIKKLSANTIKINNLYLDCNSIIYDAVHNIDFTALKESDADTIIRAVCCKIDEYISQLKPDNCIFIAFDGVAPVAKLEQQRARRYKSLYQNGIMRSIYKNTRADPWNTTAITPGTKFMAELNDRISKHFNIHSFDRLNVLEIFVSGSNIVGVGEHKLFDFIRECPQAHTDDKNTIILNG